MEHCFRFSNPLNGFKFFFFFSAWYSEISLHLPRFAPLLLSLPDCTSFELILLGTPICAI